MYFTSRIDAEFSVTWIVNNPDIFKASHDKFVADHPADKFEYKAYFRPGFITLSAIAK